MYGKTSKQLGTRLKIAGISAVIGVIVCLIVQFCLFPVTWDMVLVILIIGVPAYVIYFMGLLTDWKTQWLDPIKISWDFVSGKGIAIFTFPFIYLAFLMLGCLKTYIIGIKALIYVFSSKE